MRSMTQRKQWSDFSTGQQSAIVLGAVLEFAFLAAALWDIWHRPVEEIKGGARRNANPDMVEQVKNFSERDVIAVSDFTSRLKPPKELLAESADWQNPDFQ